MIHHQCCPFRITGLEPAVPADPQLPSELDEGDSLIAADSLAKSVFDGSLD